MQFTLTIQDIDINSLELVAELLYEANFDDGSVISFSGSNLYIDCIINDMQYDASHYILNAVVRARSVLGENAVIKAHYYDDNDLITMEFENE